MNGRTDIGMLWHYDRKAFWASAMIGAVIAGIVTGAYWTNRMLNNPPDAVLAAEILNPVIEQGGTMRLMVTIRSMAMRQCRGDITREFWRMVTVKGEQVPDKWRVTAPRPINVDEEPKYIVNVALPPGMEPGVWSFRGETAYFCDGMFGGGKRYRSNVPGGITIVPKGSPIP